MGLIDSLMLDFKYPAFAAYHKPVKINVTWRTPWFVKFYVPLTYPLWRLLGKLRDVRWMKHVAQLLDGLEVEG